MSIFKQCDIRGVFGKDLNESVARSLGKVVGERSVGRSVVVAGDLRTSTRLLKENLIDALVYGGAEVVDVGTLPTPALYFAKQHLGAWGSIMVTASHNPPQYNGFKLMLGSRPIEPQDLQAIEHEMRRPAMAGRLGSLSQHDILPAYRAQLHQAFPSLRRRRIVVDAGNGSLSELAPEVLSTMGMDVVPLYCTPDGRFPNRDPNPAVVEHLGDLRDRVIATEAEIGVAYDGDGDRAIFVDSRGRVLPADRAFVLLVRDRLALGDAVVYDLKSSSVVAQETDALGGRPIMERSGHAFIKRRLMDEKAVLGGEVSGHYFFGELEGDDALYATLAMLTALDHADATLAQAIETVPAYPITPDLRLPCPTDRARAILDSLREQFSDLPLSFVDGVRIDFGDGWALARLSVTEPLITLRFEAHTDARLREITHDVFCASTTLRELGDRASIDL